MDMKIFILTLLIFFSFLFPSQAAIHGIIYIEAITKVENEKILIEYSLEKLNEKNILPEYIQSAKLYIGKYVIDILQTLPSLKYEIPFEKDIQLSDCTGDICNPEGYPYLKIIYAKGLKVIQEEPIAPDSIVEIKEEKKEIKGIAVAPVPTTNKEEITKKEDPAPIVEEHGTGGSNIVFFPLPKENTCSYDFRWKLLKSCTIQKPQIIEIEHIKQQGTYTVKVKGVFNPSIKLLIDNKSITQNGYYKVNIYINNRLQTKNVYRQIDKHIFEITLISPNKYTNADISVSTEITSSFKYSGKWIDINKTSDKSKSVKVPQEKVIDQTSNAPFSFPFKKVIGVTQWHGNTAFQAPHTGIDFGSIKEPIYAIADGEIMEAKLDDYYGKCLSGGYYIKIKHNNGKYSVYLHLKDLNGRKKGTYVKKGELLAYSGNTGTYNCQPLGYHLHFEIRKGDLQATHTNPVPYINIDWNTVPTLDAKKYPQRLSGENPHITF